jgi:hypothetical protein
MVIRLVRKLKLFLNPPKKGHVFYGDPSWFVIARPVEHVLHGLKDSYGVTVFTPVPSKDCFRFTVEHRGNLNYILGSEVFCKEKTDNNIGTWKKRTQPRRMALEMFEELVLNGLLWR